MTEAIAALHNQGLSIPLDTSRMSRGDKEILEEGFALTLDYISYRLFEQHNLSRVPGQFFIPQTSRNSSSRTIRKMATSIEKEYSTLFENLCARLAITPSSAFGTFNGVAHEIFQDGKNWGRIVALITFGGVVASHFVELQRPELVQHVAKWIAWFIADNLLTWIRENGGWDGLVDFFAKSRQPPLWRSLLIVASICAAGFTLLALNNLK